MLIGSLANGLASSGGFCAGSQVVVDHQRINGTSFVYSASLPALLAVSASEGISILKENPNILATLQDNIRAVHSVLNPLVTGGVITIPSHPASPIIHVMIKPLSPSTLSPNAIQPSSASKSGKSNPSSIIPRDPPTFDVLTEEKLLQEVVEECLAQGVLVTRAKRLGGQEMVEAKPSIRIAVTSALGRKEVEKAAGILKASLGKVLGRRR